jgi:hypothetical protein
LAKAIAAAKTITALTGRINKVVSDPDRKLTVQAVAQWVDVPPDRCLEVERATGITRYELRPDIYGKPPKGTGKRPKTSVQRPEIAA